MRIVELSRPPSFGAVRHSSDEAIFELLPLVDGEIVSTIHLKGAHVVLASADNHLNLHLAALCLKLGIPCIYDIEYTFKSRVQLTRQEEANPLRLLKTLVWLSLNERKVCRAIDLASSVQANGLPAFDRYASGKSDPLLYFDNRMSSETCIHDTELEDRLSHLDRFQPLRLAFSGRLIKAKGADALINVALGLRRLGTRFDLHIFGTGELENDMRSSVTRHGLCDQVHLHGTVDFEHELLPFIKRQVDLFVCCHRQGDPSCTYLETYGCGVPIAGYANEAHSSMLDHHDVGWKVSIDDVESLCALITSLDASRDQIRLKARAALAFAHDNLFDTVFSERMAHCLRFAAGKWTQTTGVHLLEDYEATNKRLLA